MKFWESIHQLNNVFNSILFNNNNNSIQLNSITIDILWKNKGQEYKNTYCMETSQKFNSNDHTKNNT